MAINSTTRQTTPYTTGNSFAFAFKVFTEADVKVIKIQTSNNAQTILNITSDYTVQLNGDQNDNPGGSVTLTSGTLGSGSLAGFTIVITSKVEAKQLTELTNQGGFFPEVINDALDKSVILHQQQQNVIDKTIRFQQTDSVTGLEITDSPTTRANKTISFDSSGDVSLIGPVVTTNDTGTVSTNMIGDDQVTPAKIGNADLKNLSSCQTGGSAALSDLTQAEIQILDGATVSTSELNVLQGVNNTLSASELNVLDGITASTANLNQLTNKEVETSITANSDAKIPTSKAVNDRILTVTNALGGFVAIANKTSFPSTHPDPSENAGTVISISDADGISINNSGVASIPNGAGTGNTVTITGFATDLYNATLSAGVGMQVQTTATLHEYTYHKVLVKEQDLLNLSNDINDFGNRYRVVETTPLSNNDEGDLIFRKSDNKLLVYNGTAYQEASSVGNFYSNTLSSFNGTGGNSATFNGTAYRFNIDHPPELAEQLLVSINGVIQKPNSGTSQPSEGFVLSGSSIIFSAAPASGSDFFIITIGKTVDIGEINDGVVTNAKVASNAAIQGTKINSNFGSQNVTTTGFLNGKSINLTDGDPAINFFDDDANPDFKVVANGGIFRVQDSTNGQNRIRVLADGTVDVGGNLDVGAGLDVTGAITSTGGITTNNNITIADSIIHQGDTDTKIRFSDANTITFETAGDQILQITPAGHLNLMQGNFYLNDSIIHAGDGDTKIRFPGLDQVSIETGGSEKLKVDANGNVLMPTDDGKLQIGNDQDLEIFHGGSGNYTNLNVIKTTNNKTLLIETASGGIAINNRFGTGATNFENMMTIVPNNAVKAYYDGVKKFETTATGTQISCGPDGDGLKLQGTTNRIDIVANTNRAGAANTILELDAHWNNTPVAFIALGTGDDTTNKDDGRLRFFTKPSGGTITERLKIEPDGNVQIPADGIRLQLGANQDLQLYHQHTTSSYGGLGVIASHVMPLAFKTSLSGNTEDGMVIYPNNRVELMYDNSKKFQTTSTGIDVTGKIRATQNIEINADNMEFRVGANGEFRISHTGSDNILRSDDDIKFRNMANNETIADFKVNDSVNLYYDNSVKLQTTSTGVSVTGNTTFTSGNRSLDLILAQSPTTGNVGCQFRAGSGDFIGLAANGTGIGLVINDSNNVGIGKINPSTKLDVNGDVEISGNIQISNDTGRIKLGASQDLVLRHNGSSSYIENSTGFLFIHGNDIALRSIAQENYIVCDANAEVELYYDGSKKLETTSTGVRVNGQLTTVSNVGIGTTSPNINNGYNTLTLNASSNGGVLAFCINDVRKGLIYTESDGDLKFQSESGQQLLFASGGSTNRLQITSTGQVRIPNDGQELAFGGSQDLKIYHSGQQSFIDEVGVGSLYIRNGTDSSVVCNTNAAVELFYDGSKKFETTSTGVKGSGTQNVFGSGSDLTTHNGNRQRLAIIGSSSSGSMLHIRGGSPAIFFDQSGGNTPKIYQDNNNLEFYAGTPATEGINVLLLQPSGNVRIPNDNAKLQIGASQDLELYHDGSHSRIVDAGTGNLVIQTDGYRLRSTDETEVLMMASKNSSVDLYYDNVKRLETTSTGATVTTTSAANSIKNITTSTSGPSGGSDGDLWFTYVA